MLSRTPCRPSRSPAFHATSFLVSTEKTMVEMMPVMVNTVLRLFEIFFQMETCLRIQQGREAPKRRKAQLSKQPLSFPQEARLRKCCSRQLRGLKARLGWRRMLQTANLLWEFGSLLYAHSSLEWVQPLLVASKWLKVLSFKEVFCQESLTLLHFPRTWPERSSKGSLKHICEPSS